MASLSTPEKKNTGKRFRSDSDTIAVGEPAANPLRDYILESARTIHRTELTMAFLRWLLAVVAVFFSLVLVDQWLWPLTTAARYVVWVSFIGGTVLWFTMMVLPLIGRTIHPHYAARQIETTLPEMKEGLITWVQLSGSDSPPPKSVLNAVGRYVAKQLKGQDIASVIDQLNPLKLAAALMGLTLIGAIYLATSPKNVPATIQRLLMPWANVAPATRVQIVSITPGDTSVIQGSSASIAIQVRGWQRQDRAVVRYSTDDGQTVDQRVAMSSDIEGLSYRIELGKSFGGILQPMHYWIEAGDAVAGPFAIQVQAIPLSILERVDYVYPEYTRLSPRTIESDGRIEGPEGTRVRITAKGNQPMKSARVEFDSTLAKDGSYQPEWIRDLQVDDRLITGEWILEVNEKRSNPSRYQYRIRSTNTLGESASEPVVYPMTVVADIAPEVDFAAETKDAIEVAENGSIDVEVRATDPDFGLMKLVLEGTPKDSKNRGPVWQEILLDDALGITGQSVHTISIVPKKLGYQAGDQIELVLTASDNRHDPQTKKLAANVVKSRVVSLKVTPPTKNAMPNESDPSGKDKDKDKDKDPNQAKSQDGSNSKNKSENEQSKQKPSQENSAEAEKTSPGKQAGDKLDANKAGAKPGEQANESRKNDSQKNSEQNENSSQTKTPKTQPENKASDQPQRKDEQSPDQQPKPDQQQSKDSKSKDQQSKDQQSKDQQSKQQPGNEKGSGDDQSGASESSDASSGQQGSQKSAGGKSGGKSSDAPGDSSSDSPSDQAQGNSGTGNQSKGGNDNSGMKNNPSNSDPSDTNASDGDASDGQTPTHDGEAFERLEKILKQSNPGDSSGSKSNKDAGASDDKSNPRDDSQGTDSSGDSKGSETSKEKGTASQGNASEKKADDAATGQPGGQPSSQANGQKREQTGGEKSSDRMDDTSAKGDNKASKGNASGAEKSKPGNKSAGDESSGNKPASNESSDGAKDGGSSNGKSNQQKTPPSDGKAGEDSNSLGSNANDSPDEQGTGKSPDGKANDGKQKNSAAEDTNSMSGESGNSKAGNSKSDSSKGDAGKPSESKVGESPSGESKSGEPSSGDGKSQGSPSQKSPAKDSPSKGSSSKAEGTGKGDGTNKGEPSNKGTSGDSKSASDSKSDGSSPGGSSSGGSQGMNASGESGASSGGGKGGAGSKASAAEDNTEYAKSATDLVLESLKRQREQPDPELLKRMGWSKEQMQSFVDRWQGARDQAMTDPSKKKEYEDMLQSLGLVPQTGSTRAVRGRTDGLSGMREEGSRVRPPESLRERFEAFRKASQQPGTK